MILIMIMLLILIAFLRLYPLPSPLGAPRSQNKPGQKTKRIKIKSMIKIKKSKLHRVN